MTKLAVLPARGGSKRIPRKNIKPFCGRPMIAWSITAARDAGLFDRIVVSTDDPEIADVASREGAEVPFLRPAALSDDHTPTAPVIAHAVGWAEREIGPLEAVCCIYAAAPFIDPSDLSRGYALLRETRADFTFPVTSFPFPIQRAVRLRDDGRMEMFSPEHATTRSQDLEEAYHDVGQFYWGAPGAWASGDAIIGPRAAPLVIPRHRAQDIDTPEDWVRAEHMFRALRAQAADPSGA